MSLNDMHPTGAQATYPGVANPTTSNANVIEDIPSKDSAAASSDDTEETKGPSRDTIEAQPGLIESTELAPLGDEKVVADPGLVTQATILGKKAYEAVVGSSESK